MAAERWGSWSPSIGIEARASVALISLPCARARVSHIVATDFFHTALLKRLYVLFFIDVCRRPAWITRVTAHPNATWVSQPARNVARDTPTRGLTSSS
ncbi:MAG: hypothetical protein ABSC30_06030 [Acidimicrobiales bacterium]|jgi:hypothetical protein